MPTFDFKRYGKGLLRAMVAAGISFTMSELTGINIIGCIPVAGVVAALGKLLRDKVPKLSWLPF